jgi:glycine cleavage system H lipoate-binding protein
VWKRSGGETEPVEVILGITDHAFTAATRVVVGELKEGDELVTRTIQTRSNAPTGQGARR